MTELAPAESPPDARPEGARFVDVVRMISLFLAILITSIVWALSTPPGYSAEERQTMLAIVCGSGGATSECPPNLEEPDELQVSGGWGDNPCFVGEEQSAECLLAGPNWTQYKVTVFYNQLPTDSTPFHRVLRTFVDADPFRSLVKMRLAMALLGSTLLAGAVLLLRDRSANFLRVWLAVGTPVAMLQTASVTQSGWQLIATPSLTAAMCVLLRSESQRSRLSAIALALFSSVVMLLSGNASVLLIVVTVSFSIFMSERRSITSESMRDSEMPSGVNIAASSTAGYWSRFCRSPITLWLSVAVLVLVNFQQHVWKRVLLYLPSQLDEFRVIRTIAQLPNFAIGFLGAGRWRLGYSDLTFPYLATMSSIAVIGAIMYVGGSEARRSLRVRFAILVVLLANAVVMAHEGKGIEIGGDPSLVSQFLPYFVVLMLMVPLFTETRFQGKTVHVVNGLIVLAVGASLWGTLRRYVTGFPETPYSEGSCLFCDLSPQLWWWNRWYEPVLGPRLTWLIAIVATIWALYLASKLGSRFQVADSRSARIRAVAGLVVLSLLGLRLTLPWLVELSPARWAQ